MALLQAFLKSYVRFLPKIQVLSAGIQRKDNLIVNYPLTLQPTSSGRFALTSENSIKRGNDLMLMGMSECIFSSGFTAATPGQQEQIDTIMKKLSSEYESMNKDFMQKMKIYIQLLANRQTIRSGNMPARQFSEYVFNQDKCGLEKSDINSRYLFDLSQALQKSSQLAFQYMKKDLIKRVQKQQFLEACNKGRLFIRAAGFSPYYFAAPFIDKIDHSADPNCQFQMMYMPHKRSPFVRIRSIRNIKAGERPTINYGKLNNYQLLLRYGFSVHNNPNSIFMLPLNFENIIEVFNKNIEWKQQQLLNRQMRLKNYIKLLPNGQLHKQDLTMMRILICDGKDPKPDRIESSEYDQLINKFISDHAKGMRNVIKINSKKVTTNKFIKILEDEQISILDNYLSKHQA